MPAAFLSPLIVRALSHDELKASRSSAQLYQLVGDFVFDSEIVGRVTVPDGFVTDFASVPRLSKWFVDDDSPEILFASCVHDYLYSTHDSAPLCTRAQADAVLAEGMAVCGASYLQRKIILLAVRAGGSSHWKK